VRKPKSFRGFRGVVLRVLSAEPNMSLECQKMMQLLAALDSSIGKRKAR